MEAASMNAVLAAATTESPIAIDSGISSISVTA